MSNKKLFSLAKIILIFLLFGVSLLQEQAHGLRFFILFMGFLSIEALTMFLISRKKRWQLIGIMGLQICIILIMELNTKFAVNYLFHCFYMFIIIEAGFYLNAKESIGIGCSAIVGSAIKYIYLLTLSPNYQGITEMFFAELALILLLVTSYLFSQYVGERQKVQQQVQVLAREEERKRVARDLHDTLGHQLTGIIMSLELLGLEKSDESRQARLLTLKSSARDALKDLRQVVEALNKYKGDTNIFELFQELIQDFENKTNLIIDLQVSKTAEKVRLSPMVSYTLYHVVEEALTNSVKHGHASHVSIHLSHNASGLEFSITNDGLSCETITEGNGLKGMKTRLDQVKGDISFYSKDGFAIRGHIPLTGGV